MKRITIPGTLLSMLIVVAASSCTGMPQAAHSTAMAAHCPPPGGQWDSTGSLTFDSTAVDRDAEVLSIDTTIDSAPPGHAILRFVIDSSGRADLRTLTVEPGSDSLLGIEALLLVPHTRFRPALLQGCRVRVWARWPWSGS